MSDAKPPTEREKLEAMIFAGHDMGIAKPAMLAAVVLGVGLLAVLSMRGGRS
jgi:hypothetical protein